jgi:predicted nucleotidyltransferase
MIQLYQKIIHLKVLKAFFKQPYEEFHLRGLARKLRMDPMTLKRKLVLLVKDGLIVRRMERGFHLFKANIEDVRYLNLKKSYNVSLLIDHGLVKDLLDSDPSIISIVLFGSMAKGTDAMDSDVDILVMSPRKEEKRSNWIKVEGRKVNIVSVTPSEWSLIYRDDKPFYDEVLVHGIALHGRKPVV